MIRVISVSTLLLFLALGATGHAQAPQTGTNPAAEVREIVDAARKDIDTFKKAGGTATTPDHPALKWATTLWNYRERTPQSDAGALAAVEAVRLLLRNELWDGAHARIDSLDVNDLAWERIPAVLYYDDGSARKDFTYTLEKLSRVASATTNPAIKSASLLTLGRVHRRQGNTDIALRSLETARDAAPGTPSAGEADGIIYEIKYLSVGLPAPSISAKARNGTTVDLHALRGKVVVLLFWGST